MNRRIAELDNEALATGASQGSEDAVRVHYWRRPMNWAQSYGRRQRQTGEDGGRQMAKMAVVATRAAARVSAGRG